MRGTCSNAGKNLKVLFSFWSIIWFWVGCNSITGKTHSLQAIYRNANLYLNAYLCTAGGIRSIHPTQVDQANSACTNRESAGFEPSGIRVRVSAVALCKQSLHVLPMFSRGFLWVLQFPPTIQKHAEVYCSYQTVRRCVCVSEWGVNVPRNRLAPHPGLLPSLHTQILG